MDKKKRNRKQIAYFDRFVQLKFEVMYSEAFWTLSARARDLFILMLSQYNGSNADKLVLRYEDARKITKMGHQTLAKAFRELIQKGFLDTISLGGLNAGGRYNASVYKLRTRYQETSNWWWSWKEGKLIKTAKLQIKIDRIN